MSLRHDLVQEPYSHCMPAVVLEFVLRLLIFRKEFLERFEAQLEKDHQC